MTCTKWKQQIDVLYKLSNKSSHTSRSNLGLFITLDEIHSYNTRKKSKTNYFLPRVNTAQTQKLLIYNGTKIWNQILKEIREMKFLKFNKEIQNLYRYISQYSRLGPELDSPFANLRPSGVTNFNTLPMPSF